MKTFFDTLVRTGVHFQEAEKTGLSTDIQPRLKVHDILYWSSNLQRDGCNRQGSTQ